MRSFGGRNRLMRETRMRGMKMKAKEMRVALLVLFLEKEELSLVRSENFLVVWLNLRLSINFNKLEVEFSLLNCLFWETLKESEVDLVLRILVWVKREVGDMAEVVKEGEWESNEIRLFWNTGIPSAMQLLVVNSCCWQDWLILGVFADSGLDLLQCKCKPVLSSQVLGRIVFVLHLSEQSSTSVATSKAEQEFVKNIFGVISQLPDYLHPSFNLRINFFPLVSNSQSCL
nr:hypothetical protein Iba_chr04aCG24210 [Ipomoea batatas]